MIYLFLQILTLNEIFCYRQIPGTFDKDNALEGYITPEDNMLIFSYNISGKMELYKYEKDSNSNTYSNGYKLELEPFPENSSDIINNNYYIHIKQVAARTIQFAFFNEKYISSHTFKESSNYYIVSMEAIGPNQFAIFYNPINSTLNNTIRIASFNHKNETFNFTKSYTINGVYGRANCYCVKTSNNNIVCGLIEYNYTILDFTFYYNFILLQDEKPIQKIKISNHLSDSTEYLYKGLFSNNFLKLIPLEDNKIIYCLYYSYFNKLVESLSCGLVQVQNNSKIVILLNGTNIFNKMAQPNYLRRNLFSAIKINNNEIILACVYSNSTRNISKLTITNNNTFIKEYRYLYYTNSSYQNFHNYIQILNNKDNDIIFLIIYKEIAKFHEFGYSYCDNKIENLYNGYEKRLVFNNYDPGLFKGHDNDIVFINNTKGLNSIVYGDNKEKVVDGTIYKANEIYFSLSLNDLNYIKNTSQYNITFRNTLNEKESETCVYTLNFTPCDKECDICGYEKDECYDKNWKKVDRNKKATIKFINIVSVLIFLTLFSIIILILFGFIQGIKLSQNRNRNANLNNGNIINNNLIEMQ